MKLWMTLKIIGGEWEMSMGRLLNNWKLSSSNLNIIIFNYFSAVGYIPSNYVKEKEFLGLQKYE